MHQFLSAIGRKCSVVNLDPANDHTSYDTALDVRGLVTLEDIMKDDELGPNGAVLYALEELEHNWEWLEDGLKELGGKRARECLSWLEIFAHRLVQRTMFCSTARDRSSCSPIIRRCGTSSFGYRSLGTESASTIARSLP